MSKYIRQALEVATMISCLMLGISAFYICIELYKHGVFSSRFYTILAVCFTVLIFAVIFSIKSKVKTICILLALTSLVFFMLIASTGLHITMNNLFEEKQIFNLSTGLIVLMLGCALSWVSFNSLKSQRLK